MNQRWLAKRSSQRPAAPRVRDRTNKYGKRGTGPGSGNRCGHNPLKFVEPKIRRNLPHLNATMLAAFRERLKPSQLVFRFGSRSEQDEVMGALVPVMIAWTCVVTQRIGRPSKKERGGFEGLTIDYDLARMTNISESRIERGIGVLKDWKWLTFKLDARGHRRSSQRVEETESGGHVGHAAIRKWTEQFCLDLGISQTAIKEAVAKYLANVERVPDHIDVAPLLSRLAEDLALAREKPPP